MKKILVIKDPKCEVGFEGLCNYCEVVAQRINDENTLVLPMWPHGRIDYIGNKKKLQLYVNNLEDILNELNIELKKGENNS